MQPEVAKFLQDMLRHAERVHTKTQRLTVEQFVNDETLVESVSMNFVVIGESLNEIRKRDTDVAGKVSEWRRIIGFRHQLVHGYSLIDDEITWKIIQDKLPILIAELRALLNGGIVK